LHSKYALIFAGANYENFVEDLKEAESLRQCRYGIYDAQYTLKDGQNRNKIVFFLWYVAVVLVTMHCFFTCHCLNIGILQMQQLIIN